MAAVDSQSPVAWSAMENCIRSVVCPSLEVLWLVDLILQLNPADFSSEILHVDLEMPQSESSLDQNPVSQLLLFLHHLFCGSLRCREKYIYHQLCFHYSPHDARETTLCSWCVWSTETQSDCQFRGKTLFQYITRYSFVSCVLHLRLEIQVVFDLLPRRMRQWLINNPLCIFLAVNVNQLRTFPHWPYSWLIVDFSLFRVFLYV